MSNQTTCCAQAEARPQSANVAASKIFLFITVCCVLLSFYVLKIKHFFLYCEDLVKTFSDKITYFNVLTFIHNSRATKKVVFFSKNEVFAPKSHFSSQKSDFKFPTSDFRKTTSEVILTTSDLVLTTFELVFAIFEPKKGGGQRGSSLVVQSYNKIFRNPNREKSVN